MMPIHRNNFKMITNQTLRRCVNKNICDDKISEFFFAATLFGGTLGGLCAALHNRSLSKNDRQNHSVENIKTGMCVGGVIGMTFPFSVPFLIYQFNYRENF